MAPYVVQRNAADLKEKLDTRILILHKATCNARAKQAVNVAFETRIKVSFKSLAVYHAQLGLCKPRVLLLCALNSCWFGHRLFSRG